VIRVRNEQLFLQAAIGRDSGKIVFRLVGDEVRKIGQEQVNEQATSLEAARVVELEVTGGEERGGVPAGGEDALGRRQHG